ncbi:N-acetylneuraminate synthase family protein [Pseudomonadales bacterium]|nr:N-acetylneuraminate synthase family protein [Pseudomonadales bacterium]
MMKNIFVDGKEIGGNQTYIVAEIGSNHNQSLSLAYESIDAAADCGADAVKFQSIDVEQVYYQPKPKIKELHRKIDMDEKWHWLLSEYCRGRGITFFSAPTYIKAIDIMEEVGVSLYKLASAQIGTFPQLVQKVAATGKPVILSTGIVTTKELNKIVELFKLNKNDKFIILHCNSIYPTPYDRVHLNIIDWYKKEFGCVVGFSDHTADYYISVAAVALGAKVIEKHFALDKSLPVPDAEFSLEPDNFKRMVEGIRATEQAVIPGMRAVLEPEEIQFKKDILYRLVASKRLISGQTVSERDFRFLRHPEGLDCRDLPKLLSRNAVYSRDISKNKLVFESDIGFEII